MEPLDSISEASGTGSPPATPLTTMQLKPNYGALFGVWMLGRKYNNAFPKDQFMVSAREREVGGRIDAGQAYTFHLPPGS